MQRADSQGNLEEQSQAEGLTFRHRLSPVVIQGMRGAAGGETEQTHEHTAHLT